MICSGSYKGLQTSLRNFKFSYTKFKLLKGSSLPFCLSLLSDKFTSPAPSLSTSSQKDRSRDSPSLNSMTSNSDPYLEDDLSLMEILGSTASMVWQFQESTSMRICLGSRKQMRKMEAFSLELKSTLRRVAKSPRMHLRAFTCSQISNLIIKPLTKSLINRHYILTPSPSLPAFDTILDNKIIRMIRENSTDFERKFTTNEAFKRNRNYYDIIKLNEEEHIEQQKRRKPLNIALRTARNIEKTFQSAKRESGHRVDEDIDKFKFRLSFYESTKHSEQDSTGMDEERSKSPREIKGVPLQKVISREKANKKIEKQVLDERLFNNFSITQHSLSQTPSIGNYSPRNLSIALKHMTDLYYDSQRKYEEVYFDSKATSCTFNLKKQNDQKQRYFFLPQREDNLPSTDLNPESVARSFSVANPYRTGKILNFYKVNGRELPSQFDERFLSPNRNFYKDKDGRLVKQEMSFTARKYRDQLLVRDLDQIKKSKKPYFNRDEICDERYFKQEKRNFEARESQ